MNKKQIIILVLGLSIATYILLSKSKTETNLKSIGNIIYLKSKTPFSATIDYFGTTYNLAPNVPKVIMDGSVILEYKGGKVFQTLPYDQGAINEIPYKQIINVQS